MKGRGEARRFQKGHPGIGGRPDVRLRDNPDKYYVAFYEALIARGNAPNKAARLVAMLMAGERFAMNDAALAHLGNYDAAKVKGAWQASVNDYPAGYAVLAFKERKGGRFPAGFPARIKGIQRKARDGWSHPEDRHWLYNMELAIAFAFLMPLKEISRYLVFGYADIAGERQFAVNTLLPIVYMRLKADGALPEKTTWQI
jgi:hypothetical protein